MYTSGHTHILEKALELLKKEGLLLKKDEVSYLKDGLKYPDFPCGRHSFDGKQVKLQFERRLCSIFGLLGDLNNVFASAFSSHNGYFSVWHAMTYHPARPVHKINTDIMDQIMAFLRLSVSANDDNDRYFWLGMALHTIMDSYSPAHVLRLPATKDEKHASAVTQQLIGLVKQYPAENDGKFIKMNAILKDMKDGLLPLSKTIESEDAPEIQALVDNISRKHEITSKRQREQLHALAMFLFFFNHHQLSVKDWNADQTPRRVAKASITASKLISKSPSPPRPIITYYYYPQQSGLFHKINDTLYAARAQGLEERAIYDTYALLALFVTRDTQNNDIFLNAAKAYLFSVTFQMAEGVENLNTGVNNSFPKALKMLEK